jgi:MFS family permease
MLFFGVLIDKVGRRTGIFFATIFLIIGIVLATASHGKDQLGLFWMMIVGRGIAGFGAGGEYPVCATTAAEASDETSHVRRRRGFLVAMSTDFAVDLGFVFAGIVALIVLACYNQKSSEGVWRVCFGLGIVVSDHKLKTVQTTNTNPVSSPSPLSSIVSAWQIRLNFKSMPLKLIFPTFML